VAVGGTSADRARSHTPRHVSHFQRIYTDEQKAAVAEAFEDRRIRPATRVADLAKAGELRYQGEMLDPFNIEAPTVRHEARMLRKRRAGQLTSKLSDVPARDAVEQLRRRMVNLADAELTVLERQKAGSRNPETSGTALRSAQDAAQDEAQQDDAPRSLARAAAERALSNA
jgi:hypothetical protein